MALGSDVETVDEACRHWVAGRRCFLPPKDFAARCRQPGSYVEKIGPEVVRLIDEEGQTLRAVTLELGVYEALVRRA